jgi:hypothetical protein
MQAQDRTDANLGSKSVTLDIRKREADKFFFFGAGFITLRSFALLWNLPYFIGS